MFERNKIDNTPAPHAVPVEITLDDGTFLKGKFWVPMGRSIYDVLNGSSTFVDFESYGSPRCLLAKTSLKSVVLVGVPKSTSLADAARALDDFDPHTILGVGRDATFEEVRKAYLARSMVYHPDRYANSELPGEVRDYLAAMARRINAAYAALERPFQSAKLAAGQRSTPVFTSPGRG
jgi:hypothetical protein